MTPGYSLFKQGTVERLSRWVIRNLITLLVLGFAGTFFALGCATTWGMLWLEGALR